MDTFEGMVVRTDGAVVTVRDEAGQEWRCVLRGRLRSELAQTTSPVAVGDRVDVDVVGPLSGAVRKVLPRRSQLMRAAAGDKFAPAQVLAANLDLVVIVVPCPPRPTVIDRFLAIASSGGCPPLVCANKIDLADRGEVDRVLESYRRAAVPVVLTSALTGEGVEEIRRYLGTGLAAFVGPSGAGKTSLVRVLDPSLTLRVAPLARGGRGSHTTSWAATYRVGPAMIVDTPGLREVGFLADEGARASEDLFPDISALASGCRFRDCSHTHEPKCAVKAAVEAGAIDAQVYRRYARLARSGRV